jgi:hypothetical protein
MAKGKALVHKLEAAYIRENTCHVAAYPHAQNCHALNRVPGVPLYHACSGHAQSDEAHTHSHRVNDYYVAPSASTNVKMPSDCLRAPLLEGAPQWELVRCRTVRKALTHALKTHSQLANEASMSGSTCTCICIPLLTTTTCACACAFMSTLVVYAHMYMFMYRYMQIYMYMYM